ncbi:MAG: hypothetical protein ABIK41_05380 [candidate division WOR-3 bacterium]
MNEAHNIGLEFLQRMDAYLRQNLHSLSCGDICNIYLTFWENLKNFRGTSEGFTGLAEFLIFRVLYHLLEEESGAFFPQSIGQLIKFVNNNFQIGQNLPINIGNRRKRPDIVIYRNNPADLIILQ